MPCGLMARRLTLDQFIEVRILAGQPILDNDLRGLLTQKSDDFLKICVSLCQIASASNELELFFCLDFLISGSNERTLPAANLLTVT